MERAAFLLATGARFGGQRPGEAVARALGRADHAVGAAGEREQLRRHVALVPDHWPLAALTRRVDADDADSARWLRADPAHVRADINGARLLACGNALGLTAEEAGEFLRALRPLLGDAGFPIDAPRPGHWYLRLPRDAKPPAFADPAAALGEDVFEHLPEGDAGRRWRALLSEAQVVLHNHPRNVERAARGLPAVNSLWFWGAGVLPHSCSIRHAEVFSDDEVLQALAHGNAETGRLPPRFQATGSRALYDLRAARDLAALERDWLQPALEAVFRRQVHDLELDFGDGRVATIARRQRWRLWRKPWTRLG